MAFTRQRNDERVIAGSCLVASKKKKKNEMDNCKIAGCYNLIPQQRGEDSEFLVSCTSISPSSVPSLI